MALGNKKHSQSVDFSPRSFSGGIRLCVSFILIFIAFFAGFMVRGDKNLLESLGISQYAVDVERNPGATVSGNTANSIGARVAEMEGILKQYSFDSYNLEVSTNSLLSSFAAVTNDPYCTYYDKERYAKIVADSNKNAEGIGVLFSDYEGRTYVADVFESSYASNEGVMPGDVVVAIDGDGGKQWTSSDVMAAINKKQGDVVTIEWMRPNKLEDTKGTYFVTTIKVGSPEVKNINATLEGSVGVISIHQISNTSLQVIKKTIEDLLSEGAQSFVLDLRGNSGGYLTQAVDIASLFIPSGTIVKIKTNSEESQRTATGEHLTSTPLVVLIDDNTASSAEVLAAALKENDRATLIGTKTLGKGSVQVTREFSFGGALRYTAAYYLSPLGYNIEGNGVSPDIALSSSDDKNEDEVLDYAIYYLKTH